MGIGDDAAVLAGGLVASTDMLVEGVHFDRSRLTAREIGHRAAAANLSDLAAMGARPLCLLAAVGVPEGFDELDELTRGLAGHDVAVAGGDLSSAPVLTVAVTALGHAEHPVLRSGGNAGDVLVVSGPLGAQAASGYVLPVTPRLAEGAELAGIATAMIDLSDGIAADVRRLARASGTRRAGRAGAPAGGRGCDAGARRLRAVRTTSCWPPCRRTRRCRGGRRSWGG